MYNPKEEYLKRSHTFSDKITQCHKRLVLYATSRLILGGVILFTAWKVFQGAGLTWTIILVLFSALFLMLVRFYNNIQDFKNLYIQLKKINDNEVDILKGEIENDRVDLKEVDNHHPYATDLDIVGHKSLFDLINRTCCFGSEEKVFNTLIHPRVDENEILKRQRAIQELTEKIDFRQYFSAHGRLKKETLTDAKELIHWLSEPDSRYTTTPYRIISVLLSVCSLVFLLAAIQNYLPHEYWMITLVFNLTFISLLTKKGRLISPEVTNRLPFLQKYVPLFKLIGEESFEDEYLVATIKNNCSPAPQELARLELLLGYHRANNFIVRGFFLPDLHIAAEMERWRRGNKSKVSQWLECLYSFDELNSFANFAYSHPQYSYPRFVDNVFVRAEGLGHPLMDSKNCVANGFDPKAKIVILTGANMSGKSTFLRSVGVNLVLAYAGAPVFATSFECCVAQIYTSMRMTDSLKEESSYFHAELKRLSQIMERLRAGEKMFILLDEVLKGTNSADKLSGSIGLVEEFMKYDCLCIIATHDLEMGKLENKYPESVRNYCFESELKNDQLSFDYKIKRGVAKNKNATFLMKKMNLIR